MSIRQLAIIGREIVDFGHEKPVRPVKILDQLERVLEKRGAPEKNCEKANNKWHNQILDWKR